MPDLSYHLQLDAMHALGKPDPHSFIILHAIRQINYTRTDVIFWAGCVYRYGTQAGTNLKLLRRLSFNYILKLCCKSYATHS